MTGYRLAIADTVPPSQPTPSGRGRQIAAAVVTVVTLVIVFAGILPRFADYGEAWAAIQEMETVWIALLVVAAAVNVVLYVFPYQAALPGLGFGAAFEVRQTSYLISNTVPGGGAFGLGVQYAMLDDRGVPPAASSAAIGITSVWNTLVMLALPVVAILAYAARESPPAWAITAGATGLVAVGILIGLLVLLFRSESTARRIGGLADRLIAWLGRRLGRQWELSTTGALLSFRESTIEVVRRRGWSITLTNLAQQLAQFSLLFLALRGIEAGDPEPVSLVGALVAFSIGRLGGFVPITPGGLGTVDALITAILVGLGATEADALAATLLWRAATFFPQVLIGLITFVGWRRRRSRGTGTQTA